MSRALEREAMVKLQLRKRGISDEKILQAMLSVPRHLFVPQSQQHLAYTDRPLPIEEDQTISQPYIVAYMLQVLQLAGNEKVLEVGTGSGYATSLLCLLAKEICTVEIRPLLAKKGREILETLGVENARFKVGDGLEGWLEEAPFDAVFVSACLKEIPETLVEQIRTGGKIIAPVASGKNQSLILLEKESKGIKEMELMGVSFVAASGKKMD